MKFAIVLFGLLIAGIGLAMTTTPQVVIDGLKKQVDRPALRIIAVGARLLLGGVLIVYAPHSNYPLTLHILGWLSLIAALGLLIIGASRFRRLIEWGIGVAQSYARLVGVIVVAFGAFLVHAVL